eukprot:88529_1
MLLLLLSLILFITSCNGSARRLLKPGARRGADNPGPDDGPNDIELQPFDTGKIIQKKPSIAAVPQIDTGKIYAISQNDGTDCQIQLMERGSSWIERNQDYLYYPYHTQGVGWRVRTFKDSSGNAEKFERERKYWTVVQNGNIGLLYMYTINNAKNWTASKRGWWQNSNGKQAHTQWLDGCLSLSDEEPKKVWYLMDDTAARHLYTATNIFKLRLQGSATEE